MTVPQGTPVSGGAGSGWGFGHRSWLRGVEANPSVTGGGNSVDLTRRNIFAARQMHGQHVSNSCLSPWKALRMQSLQLMPESSSVHLAQFWSAHVMGVPHSPWNCCHEPQSATQRQQRGAGKPSEKGGGVSALQRSGRLYRERCPLHSVCSGKREGTCAGESGSPSPESSRQPCGHQARRQRRSSEAERPRVPCRVCSSNPFASPGRRAQSPRWRCALRRTQCRSRRWSRSSGHMRRSAGRGALGVWDLLAWWDEWVARALAWVGSAIGRPTPRPGQGRQGQTADGAPWCRGTVGGSRRGGMMRSGFPPRGYPVQSPIDRRSEVPPFRTVVIASRVQALSSQDAVSLPCEALPRDSAWSRPAAVEPPTIRQTSMPVGPAELAASWAQQWAQQATRTTARISQKRIQSD